MKLFLSLLFGSMVMAGAASVPQDMQMPAPEKEHVWLEQFVGEWEAEMEVIPGPGQPAMKGKATESCKALGKFWVHSDMKVDMPGIGMNMNGLMTIGYDPQKKKYVGSWVDSVSSYMSRYEGTVDATGKILTLEAEGPDMSNPGKMAKFRDVTEFKSKDEKLFTSSMQGADGKWTTFMTSKVKRKK